MALKYNFFAEWSVPLMWLFFASCAINKALKKIMVEEKKGYTVFQAEGNLKQY